MEKRVNTPITKETAETLKAGDVVFLTGVVYAARDAAHKRMAEAIAQNQELPFDIRDQVIYYLGPSPEREGRVIGSAGPTTSGRMDSYTPMLLEKGLLGMIGKGRRSDAVKEAMRRSGAVYFAAVGGAGALLARHIKKSEGIAYEDLGTEAVRKLYVEDFPVIVVIDALGNDLYEKN